METTIDQIDRLISVIARSKCGCAVWRPAAPWRRSRVVATLRMVLRISCNSNKILIQFPGIIIEFTEKMGRNVTLPYRLKF
jgi:hypothetical protein